MSQRTEESCDYCKEFELESLVLNQRDYGNRIILESENYVVFPALGPIVPGNLLITSKAHYVGMTAIPQSLYEELEDLKEKVRKKITEKYEAPFFFEHGEVSEKKRAACCIDHAHLQVIPAGVDQEVVKDLERRFRMRRIIEYRELRENREKEVPYIFVETREGIRYVFNVPDVLASQYVRQIIAIKIGQPERWDWRNNYRIEEMGIAVERLRG